ncbi:hypothetical protein SynSYN20_01327 [Synechococcus sp. SYN20]|uniref:hypothetical protein n=1 Tax=Synechococcus sp. SYN20 TaxID=1050714 RepID=UPI00164762A2|nr:hypothetical protein [Synechococcus sp. SYN20]QNJ25661.1 hypothetical protein SynSYN20_01327 [Synechococcus sp. SYN20]
MISVAEAAEILGRSKSTIYAALNVSPPRLHYHDVRRRLLLREGLETRFARSTRPRIDKPQAQASQAKSKTTIDFEKQWEIIAETANKTLDCGAWSAPPWSGQQWAVLAGTIQVGMEDLIGETEEAHTS